MIPSEPNDETEKILEVFQAAGARWTQVLADLVLPDEFAEAVAEIEVVAKPQVYSHVRAKDRSR